MLGRSELFVRLCGPAPPRVLRAAGGGHQRPLRGSGNANKSKEKEVRRYYVKHDLIEGVIYLPENLFY